jgi:hypothetical protein
VAMTEGDAFQYTPRFNRLRRLVDRKADLDAIHVVYNEVADELVVFLFEGVEQSVALDSGDNVYMLLEPDSEEIVGFQFDNFMSRVVLQKPQLLALASLAGVDDDLIEKARQRIGEERSRQAAVQSALRELLVDVPTIP